MMERTFKNLDGMEVTIGVDQIIVKDGVEYFRCVECGDLEELNELGLRLDNGGLVCLSCVDWMYRLCEYHNRFESIESQIFYRLPNGSSICSEGLRESNEYGRCPRCRNVINYEENGTFDEETGEYFCSDCYREVIRERRNLIRGYHAHKGGRVNLLYSPLDNGQKRNTLKFGLEIEVDSDHDYEYDHNDTAMHIHEMFNKTEQGRVLYFERDGSLDNGFEIITEPMSINYMNENKNKFTDMLSYLSDEGYVGHDKGTCGLHIHLTKSVLGDKGIENFCFFVENNQDELIKFSRRQRSRLNDYASFSLDANELRHNPNGRELLMRRMNHQSRYHAVNISNRATVELRLLRGTLNRRTFFASIGFVSALGYYSMREEMTLDTDIKAIVDYAEACNMPFVEEMKEYCKIRKIKGFMKEVAEVIG